MKITINGRIGSGKSTVAKKLAEDLNLKYYSIGMLLRDLANKKGVTLLEVSKLAETDKEIDKYLDNKQKEIGKEDNIIMDSRLGFHFIPDSFKVFLDVSLDEGARRLYEDRGNRKDEDLEDIDDIKYQIEIRESSERKRYKKYYDVDPFVMSNYDLIVDTTNIPAYKVVEKILSAVRDKTQ